MKKLLLLCMLVITVVTLSGCSLIGKSEVALALIKMNNTDSYKMDLDLALDGEVILESYTYVIGEYQEMHILNETIQMFYIDGVYYDLGYQYGLPQLVEVEDYEEDDYSDFNLLIDLEFTEDEDGYYVFSGDIEFFEGVDKLKLKVEDGKISEMILEGEMELFGETYDMEIIVEYSRYDDLEIISVPEYLTVEESTDLQEYVDALDIPAISVHDSGFHILGMPPVDCVFSSESCFFESDPGVDYRMSTQEASVHGEHNWMNHVNFQMNNNIDGVTLSLFEFIDFYYELYQKYE